MTDTIVDRAHQYIKNSGGKARYDIFMEDYSPVGAELVKELIVKGLVVIKGDMLISAEEFYNF